MADHRVHFSDGGGNHHHAYCDGRRCATVSYDAENWESEQEVIEIGRDFMGEAGIGHTSRPEPLAYFHVGKVPLYEALPRAEHIGEGEQIGRDCDVFRFDRVDWAMQTLDLTYHLDSETAVPLRVEARHSAGSKFEGAPSWRWEAESLDEVGSFHLPLNSKLVSYRPSTGAKSLELGITVEDVRFDQPHARSTFWPTYQPGVVVYNSIDGTTTETPGPEKDETPAVSPGEVAGRVVAAAPIRADPPGNWGAAASTGLVGLGVVMAIVALVAWRRL
jgi:hypothetical protein